MKRAGIFNPYWQTLGGGEKYSAFVAKTLLEQDFSVSIYWRDANLIESIKNRFNLDLSSVTIDPKGYQILTSGNLLSRILFESQLDYLFWLSDGSIPQLFSKNNLLHFQVPFHDVGGNSRINQLKMTRIRQVICNSEFTKKVIDKEFNCTSKVIYPPTKLMNPGQKQPLILSVGRFDNFLHSKRQDVLIDAFKELAESGWRLVLTGGLIKPNDYLDMLYKKITGSNIEIITNPSYNELASLYSAASIYWHAAGYGSDLSSNPEHAEHFGMTTIEAMSAGAIPVVFSGGGQPEIVTSEENGYLWTSPTELIDKTNLLIHDKKLLEKMKTIAIKSALKFSEQEFQHAFINLLS